MDFNLSKEQQAIKKAAADFAKGEFNKELALKHEKEHSFPRDLLKKACAFPGEIRGPGVRHPGKCLNRGGVLQA